MGDKGDDERSMSEILSSIRRIVTDEERSRREAEQTKPEPASTGEPAVFDLSANARADLSPAPAPAPVADDAPLELGPSLAVSGPAVSPAISSAPKEEAAPLSLGAESAAPATPAAPQAAEVDFGPTPLTEAEVEAIVRRVVREELQGPIGQQISRKVKRLIREEVRAAIGEDTDTLI